MRKCSKSVLSTKKPVTLQCHTSNRRMFLFLLNNYKMYRPCPLPSYRRCSSASRVRKSANGSSVTAASRPSASVTSPMGEDGRGPHSETQTSSYASPDVGFVTTRRWFRRHQTLVSSPPDVGFVTTRRWFRHHQTLVSSSPDVGGHITGLRSTYNQTLRGGLSKFRI